MTSEEINMIDALRTCSFLPGSYDKRFVKSLMEMLAKENLEKPKQLTENQHNYLVKMFHAYRKQHLAHEPSECPVCREIKRKALEREKEKLAAWKRGEAR